MNIPVFRVVTQCRVLPPFWGLSKNMVSESSSECLKLLYQSARFRVPEHSYLRAPHVTFGVDTLGCHFHHNNGYANATQCYVIHTLPVLFLSVCTHFFIRTTVHHAVGFCFEDFVIRNGSPGSALSAVVGWGLQKHPVLRSVCRDTARGRTSTGPQQRCIDCLSYVLRCRMVISAMRVSDVRLPHISCFKFDKGLVF